MPEREPLRTSPARIVAAGLLLAAVAAAAVLALAPADTGPEPLPVAAAAELDPERLERAQEYRPGQRRLAVIGLLAELALLTMLALGRPARLLRLAERAGSRPLAGAAAVGAVIALLVALVALPPAAIAHERAVDFGLSTQSVGAWLADRGRTAAIVALLVAVGALVLVALQRHWPRWWWTGASALVVAYAIFAGWLAPVLIAPLFNDFEPLPAGAVRAEVLELAERADVDVGEVYVVDASRRGTTINAYVGGIGPTKRVVLYDNLLRSAERPALRSVLAHELGHARHRDIPRGILYVAIVAPAGMLLVALSATALARRRGWGAGTPVGLVAVGLPLTVVALALGVAGNALSREVERAADRFALELTGDPEAFIGLQRELAATNLSDPDPPGWSRVLFGTHPTTLERIGTARAVVRERGVRGEPDDLESAAPPQLGAAASRWTPSQQDRPRSGSPRP